MSRIQTLTSKITQICQDIRDIELRRLLITRSKEEPIIITNNILTNQNDHKDTLGSDRSRPETPGIHEGCAEDGNNYIYRTPNRHELGNQDNLQRHDTYRPQWPPEPSGMTPEPLPYPDPSCHQPLDFLPHLRSLNSSFSNIHMEHLFYFLYPPLFLSFQAHTGRKQKATAIFEGTNG